MKGEPACVTVLGLNVAFRQGANMERAREAARLVEERHEALKKPEATGAANDGGASGKNVIMTFLALSLADDLLQMKTKLDKVNADLESLLLKIEKSL